MKEQIIHLEPHDDIVSVRDKLGWVRAPRVLLVFPNDPRHRILQSKLDLVLLQREVTRRRAQLALITRDPVVIEHARELGIACFRSVEASHKRYWRTFRAYPRVSREGRVTPLHVDLVDAATRLNPSEERLSPQARRIIAMLVFGITLAMLLAGAYMVLPSATIYLVPARNQVSVTTTVIADPAVDASSVDATNGLIGARIVGIEVESTVTVDTTGKHQEPSQRARGIALFTNLIPDQATILAGTVVRTSAAQPVRFVTLTDATLPGKIGETVEVPIEAIDKGFVGNLPSNRINQIEGPLATRVAVTNPQPTSGGDAVEVPAISQDDYARARSLLLQQLQQRAYAEMQTGLLNESEFIPLESLWVVLIHSETYSGYVGQPADRLSLAMRVTVQGVAIDERLARQVVYAELAEKVGAGYQIGSGTLAFRRGEVTQIDEARRVTFVMQGAGDVSSAIDPAEVRAMVQGLSTHEAALRLDQQLPLAAPPDIRVWPPFWPLIPALPLRIQVEVEGQL